MAVLPLPPSGVTFIDPITGGVNVLWQNYLLALSTLGSGFAPLDAEYWVSTSNGDLTNETNLGALASGFLKITVAAGVATPSSVTAVVTSIAVTAAGGIFGVTGSPITTTGTIVNTVAGTSGGVPYFSDAATLSSSAALAATALVVGGGAGTAPATNSNFTINATSQFLSSATQGRCGAFNSAAVAITTGSNNALSFDSEDYDVGGFHSLTVNPSRLTIPAGGDGFYMFVGGTTFAATGVGGGALSLQKNGTTAFATQSFFTITSNAAIFQVVGFAPLVASDYVELMAFQNSGGNLNVGGGSRSSASELTVVKLW